MEGPVEQRIRERIRSFDVPSLLDVLVASGYGDAEIEYRSHRTTVHQSHLVHDIQFVRTPRKRVIITVNMGLLSAQSPLPSFVMRTMDQLDHDRLERFIGYFDHLLLQECFGGLYPERNEALLPGWPKAALDRLRLLRPTCPSTLHWLFYKTFPETEISVRREVRRQRVNAREMRLGASALGEGDSMGGYASIPTGGVEVRIFCNEPFSSSGVPWAVEARRRFEGDLLPLLSETVLMLTVILVLRDQEGFLRIERNSHLGFDPLRGSPGVDSDGDGVSDADEIEQGTDPNTSDPRAQHVLLFSGDTSSHQAGGQARNG